MNLISLFVTTLLSNNVILSKFLGLGTLNQDTDEKWVLKFGSQVLVVSTISSLISYLIYDLLLVPMKLTNLKTIVFILVIFIVVKLIELLLSKARLKEFYNKYTVLTLTNCLILGIILISNTSNYNLTETIVFSVGASLGYILVTYIFATLNERLTKVPTLLKGIPIALITIGIMALLFTRYIF